MILSAIIYSDKKYLTAKVRKNGEDGGGLYYKGMLSQAPDP